MKADGKFTKSQRAFMLRLWNGGTMPYNATNVLRAKRLFNEGYVKIQSGDKPAIVLTRKGQMWLDANMEADDI